MLARFLVPCVLLLTTVHAFAPGISQVLNRNCRSTAPATCARSATFRKDRRALKAARPSYGSVVSLRAEEGVRPASDGDAEIIKKFVSSEGMNPLFLEPTNFLIAEDDEGVVGVGQIRELGKVFELASLVVDEEKRGLGIGTALVTELLELHKQRFIGKERQPPSVLLLCLKEGAPFYTRLGFTELPLSMAPLPMQMEAGAGGVLAKMVKGPSAQLTCLKYKFPSVELKCDKSGTMLGGPPS